MSSATVINSTINGNFSSGGGAGIDNKSNLTVINSTISSNRSFNTSFGGGGAGITSRGSLTLNYTTITNNNGNNPNNSSPNQVGGILTDSDLGINISNSIIAKNFPNDISSELLPITIISQGNNLIGSGFFTAAPTDKVGVDPLLGPLQNNGGPTATHALLTGSPAINAGNSTLTRDQRGFGRNGIADIGAFEYEGINDLIPPSIISISPADDTTGISPTTDLVINFSEPITKTITGNVFIKKLTDNSIVETIAGGSDKMTVNGSQLIINPAADLAGGTDYYVEISEGVVTDIIGNNFAGITGNTSWNFQTQDTTPPTAISFTPLDNATGVPFASDLSINFSEPIQKGTGSIVIKKVADNSVVETIDVATAPNITVNGTQLTINPTADLAENTGYYVEIANGAIKDIAGNAYTGITGNAIWNFQTQDITPPSITGLTPSLGSTQVDIATDLVANFNEPIQKGTGSISIKKFTDNSVVETVNVTAPNVTVAGNQLTINPTNNLGENTDYYVEIANGAIKDLAGNASVGISGNIAWKFQTDDITPPTVSSFIPADNATKVAVGANLVVNFNENIKKGSTGNIVIKKSSDNSVLESIGVTSSKVTVSGNKVTINPTNNLLLNTDYYVEIGNGAIKDLAGNNYPGITGKTAWNFKSITATSGADKIIGTAGADIIDGLAGNDTITGLDSNDKLTGGDGADLLDGSAGTDTLIGSGGNDTFLVNVGNDRLTGGTGADKFTYNTKAVFKTTAVGVDTITDLVISQNDKMVLDKTTFPKITSANGTGFSRDAEFARVSSNTAAAISGADIVYNTATGEVFYNQNGTATGFGTGGKFAVLSNKPNLTENQFIIQA